MRFSRMITQGVLLASLLLAGVGVAADFGSIGPVYTVQEEDMLEWIERRVKEKVDSGEALRYQKQQIQNMKEKLINPKPLNSVGKATINRTLFFDPTFVVNENVVDEKGHVLVLAGTTINPLERVNLTRPLIFFDGRDFTQVAFAKKFVDKHSGLVKAVLIGGSYFDLMKAWQMPVYFDQQSSLIRKFGIRNIPAIVVQEGMRLRIDEIAL